MGQGDRGQKRQRDDLHQQEETRDDSAETHAQHRHTAGQHKAPQRHR
jgi:hypothetical protein